MNEIGNKSVDEGKELAFTVTASDLDSEDTVTLSAYNLFLGANFDESTGKFSWTPTHEQNGGYNVTFTASDGLLEDSKTITISVLKVYELTLEVNPSDSGTVLGGGNYSGGTQIEVTAKSKEGYSFLYWSLNGNEISNLSNFAFTMPEKNTNLVANFVEDITGAGTEKDPFLINTFEGLEKVGNERKGYSLDAYYQYSIIKNVSIINVSIINVSIINVDINGGSYNEGKVLNSYFIGYISGNNRVVVLLD